MCQSQLANWGNFISVSSRDPRLQVCYEIQHYEIYSPYFDDLYVGCRISRIGHVDCRSGSQYKVRDVGYITLD
jgi:hypothetical protein